MKNPTRREFIRIAGLLGGVSLFAGCQFLKQDTPAPTYISGAPAVDPLETVLGVENVQSVCGLCPGNCGIRCRVAQGTLVKIGGNPFNPISTADPLPFDTPLDKAVTRGASICAIGGSGIQTLYDPFRVAKPLKRVGPRGSGKWQALSWEQAVAEIVHGGDLFGEGAIAGLKALKESTSGPAILAGGADWGSAMFLKRFAAAFPGATLLENREASLRDMARAAADAVFGPGGGPVDADYRTARFVIGFGDVPLDSGVPLVSLARTIAAARVSGTGFSWAVVDPRLSTSASKADFWIPVMPGKDMDLVLGIMRGLADHSADTATLLAPALRAAVMGRSLDRHAENCCIPPDVIRKMAGLLAAEGPRAAAIPGRGVLSQPNGLETVKAVLTLNRLVGSVPGSGGLTRRDDAFLAGAEKKLLQTTAVAAKPFDASTSTGALVLWQADPVYDDPHSADRYFLKKDKVPLFVAIDRTITETSALADYILPDTTYLERWDICASPPSVTARGIGVRAPVVGAFDRESAAYVPVVAGTRPMEEILGHIAVELGLTGFQRDPAGKLPTAWHFHRRSLEAVLKSMQAAGFAVTDSPEHLTQVVQRGGLFAGDSARTFSFQRSDPRPAAPVEIKSLPEAGPVGRDELVLFTYSLPFHRSPGAGLNSWLLEVLPENRVLINSADARRLGIVNLDVVSLETLDGKTSVHCKAQVIPGIRPGTVALARGFGYKQSGAHAYLIDAERAAADKTRGGGCNPALLMSEAPRNTIRVRKV